MLETKAETPEEIQAKRIQGLIERCEALEKELGEVRLDSAQQREALEGLHEVVVEANEGRKYVPNLDERVWSCLGCGTKIGVYHLPSDELRIRMKDSFIYIRAGVGGAIKVPCRRCGYENVATDEPED